MVAHHFAQDLEVPKETFRRSALNLMENSLVSHRLANFQCKIKDSSMLTLVLQSRKRKLQDVDTVDEELATTGDKGHDTDDESAIEEESASEEETGNEVSSNSVERPSLPHRNRFS